MSEKYDSTQDTLEHIARVKELIELFIDDLHYRANTHDDSKLRSPEKRMFDKYIPLLKEAEFGSEEYKRHLEDMGVALKHHYMYNRHHPEHFQDGIYDMTLVDIVEMLCDWKAASERGGDFQKSMDINAERFEIDPQLYMIMINTAKINGWL